jgi:F-type H+/Na+-transporting ATPase subunit beta
VTSNGIIVRVVGVVVDVEFPGGDLPGITNALRVQRENYPDLVIEVQEHLNATTVRTVAMSSTAGIRRGLNVVDTGSSIRVPVGETTLGRMFNVLGEPIDRLPKPEADLYNPIHANSPALREQRVADRPFITGIKAIDLLTPYPQGGKIGLFGGAGSWKDTADD